MFATELKETLSTVNKSELARSVGCGWATTTYFTKRNNRRGKTKH